MYNLQRKLYRLTVGFLKMYALFLFTAISKASQNSYKFFNKLFGYIVKSKIFLAFQIPGRNDKKTVGVEKSDKNRNLRSSQNLQRRTV